MTIALALLVIATLAAAALVGWLAWLLQRQGAEIEERVHALERRAAVRAWLGRRGTADGEPESPARTLLNDWELPNLRGGALTFSGFRGERVAVVFVQPGCPFSEQAVRALAAAGTERTGSGHRLLIVTSGEEAANHEWLATLPPGCPVAAQDGVELARVWRILETPSAYLVGPDGVTETGLLSGCAALLSALGLEQAAAELPPDLATGTTPFDLRQSPAPVPLAPGSAVPAEAIPFGDGRTLLVFTDAACPPCRPFEAELAERARALPPEPRLVLVARIAPEAERPSGVPDTPYPISWQRNGRLARAFGLAEAPAAVLIEGGAVAAPPAFGASAIFALLAHAAAPAEAEAEAG